MTKTSLLGKTSEKLAMNRMIFTFLSFFRLNLKKSLFIKKRRNYARF